jgi:hypothetical protein
MKNPFLLVAILLASTIALAAPSLPPSKTASTTTSTAVTQAISKEELELKVLQAQSATMKEYHSSLLDTVYWALGTVATVAALLVGFGWFANFKFHEAEKQRLKEELETRIGEATARLDAHLGTREAEVLKLVDSRLDTYLTKIARDIDIAREEASRATQDNAAATKELKVTIEGLKESEKNSARRDAELEATLRLVEEHVWNLKGIPTNTLITQAQGLASSINAGNRYYIASALERMQKTIKDIVLPDKHAMTNNMVNMIDKTVATAESIEPITASAVRDLLKQIQREPEEKT